MMFVVLVVVVLSLSVVSLLSLNRIGSLQDLMVNYPVLSQKYSLSRCRRKLRKVRYLKSFMTRRLNVPG